MSRKPKKNPEANTEKKKIGRPRGRKPESNNIPITFKVSKQLQAQIKQYCKLSGEKQGEVIRSAVQHYTAAVTAVTASDADQTPEQQETTVTDCDSG